GELLQGLGVGVVLPLVGYYAQAGAVAGAPVVGLAALFLFGVAGNVLTALPDEPSDRAGEKRNWPVGRAGRRARRDALALSAVARALASPALTSLAPWGRAAVIALPPRALAASLVDLPRADPAHRAACPRFVIFAAGAGALLQLGWAV